MNLRTLTVCLALSSALLVAACGDDEDDNGGNTGATTTQTEPQSAAVTVKDVEPRSAKPNIAGGNAPIDQFITQYANDAMSYWEQVFQNSGAQYKKPTAQVVSSQSDTPCGEPFDPAQSAYYFCADPQNPSTLWFSAPFLERLREQAGDAGVAFLAGVVVAFDANEQASGNPIGQGQQVGPEFGQVATCWAGAWARNLNDRQLLEQGDTEEMLGVVARFAPAGADERVRQEVATFGFENGAGACQQQYGGGGGEETDG